MSNFNDITTAIRQLKKYGNVASLDDFFLKALQMEASSGGETSEASLSVDANAFEVVTGLTDGGYFLSEILAKIGEFSEGTDTTSLQKGFYIVGTNGVGSDTASLLSPITCNDLLGTHIGSAAENPSAPTKASPGICCIQILPAMLNYGSRDTGGVEVFMNMIPTLEWSRAVPYLDVEVITPGPQVVGEGAEMKLNGISNLRFLNGVSKIAVGSPDSIISQAKSAAAAALDATAASETAAANAAATATATAAGETPPPPEVAAKYSSAGMEIFTSPQTLVPSWENYSSYDEVAAFTDANLRKRESGGVEVPWPGQAGSNRVAPVIDKMRPFMTMNSLAITVTPTRGMMSHKSAEIKLTLHDRSRLGEIAAFVKPSGFGQTELLLEYGWSHPDAPGNNGNKNNPFGMFINALRVKEKYGVYNSKYTFKDDGQVEISLSLVSKGAAATNLTNVGIDASATEKYRAFEALVEAISTIRRQVLSTSPEMADVGGMSTISNLSPTNAGALFSGDKFAEIQAFISAHGGAGGDMQKLSENLQDAIDSTSEIQTTISNTIGQKLTIAKGTGDPFLKPRGAAKGDATPKITNHPSSPKDNRNWCSFGRLISLFVAAPLMESKRYNEVQCIFYTFNDKASWMYNQNIANFPIELNGNTGFEKLFEEWQSEKVQVSVGSFISFLNRFFLSNMAAKAYGFNNLFTRDEDGKAVISLSERQMNQLSSKKDEVLTAAYQGSGNGNVFKLPRVRMIPECVPHRRPTSDDADAFGPQDTILRLHFYDDSASKYSGLHDILSSLRNNEIGAVRQGATAAAEGPAEDSNWGAISSQFQTTLTESGILEAIRGTDFYRVIGGAPALKHFIKSNMPSITYGSQNCGLTNLSVGSMHNSADTTIHMLRAQRNSNSDNGTPGEQDRGLPLRMMPMQASGESFGCPILNHGQQFFIDMGTGTTVDNVYAVSGLDHTIEPGKFMTKFNLIPIDAFGKYESMLDQVDGAQAIITAAESAPASSE